jgi:hypothetical protein
VKTSTVIILGAAAVGVYYVWSRGYLAMLFNDARFAPTPGPPPTATSSGAPNPNLSPTAQAVTSVGSPIIVGAGGASPPSPLSPGFQPGTVRPLSIRLGGGYVGANTLAPVARPIANQQIFLPPLGSTRIMPGTPRIVL